MKIDWDTLPTAHGMRHGSTRKAICAEKISAVRVVTETDAQFDGKTHYHHNEQILVMISGRVTLTVNGKTFDAVSGDLVFFPAGSSHATIAVGAEGCVYYEIFAPARPDQLPGWVGASVLKYDEA